MISVLCPDIYILADSTSEGDQFSNIVVCGICSFNEK